MSARLLIAVADDEPGQRVSRHHALDFGRPEAGETLR